ncbi:MAG: trypsin-like peptidase domain-containing protein [Thermodesulfobacteriota bacterium]
MNSLKISKKNHGPGLGTVFLAFLLSAGLAAGCAAPPGPGREAAMAAPGQPPLVQMVPATFSDVAKKASPAVVNISSIHRIQYETPDFHGKLNPLQEFFKRFFDQLGPKVPKTQREERSLGTGFIIDPSGLVLTNDHVIREADEILIRTIDGQEYTAKALARDPKSDLALLKIQGLGTFPYLALGDSDRIQIGDWVVAIGNPFGLEHTVTAGILSARGRTIGAGPYDDFLQTDASINPGNSGGPLLNLAGEVIGINTAIVAQGQGIGFAIPANMARVIIKQLRGQGRVIRGWLGVVIQNVTPEAAKTYGLTEAQGALVADVAPGSPAAQADIKQGDIILSFDGQPVRESSDLPNLVASARVGTRVPLELFRQGRLVSKWIVIGELKD